MTTPGRNDPCPCRSGKKFKHCCLRARDAALETPGTLAWRRLRRAVDDFAMGKTLLEFVVTTYGPRAADEAWAEFSGLEEPFDPQTPHLALFMSWLFHRWSPDPHDPSSTVSAALHERIPTQLFLEHAGRRLDPVGRRYLEVVSRRPSVFMRSCGAIRAAASMRAISPRARSGISWSAAQPGGWNPATSCSASWSRPKASRCWNVPDPASSLRFARSSSS